MFGYGYRFNRPICLDDTQIGRNRLHFSVIQKMQAELWEGGVEVTALDKKYQKISISTHENNAPINLIFRCERPTIYVCLCEMMCGLSLEIVQFSHMNKINAIKLIGLISVINLMRWTTRFFSSAQIQKYVGESHLSAKRKLLSFDKKAL